MKTLLAQAEIKYFLNKTAAIVFIVDAKSWPDAARISLVSFLSESEREKLAAIQDMGTAVGYLLAHALKRLVFSTIYNAQPLDIVFEYEKTGRPHFIPNTNETPLEFSISHADGIAGLAISLHNEVGFDIESIDREAPPHNDMESYFSTEEMAQLAAAPQPHLHFWELWTAKEAYSKLKGVGLGYPLSTTKFLKDSKGVLHLYKENITCNCRILPELSAVVTVCYHTSALIEKIPIFILTQDGLTLYTTNPINSD